MEVIEQHLTVSRTARYYSIGPAPRDARAVWFVLHGYGQLAGRFVRQFESLADDRRSVIAPEAMSRFYLPANQRDTVGASWMTREDRLIEIDDYVRYLDALFAEVMSDARSPSVTVLGFSQGTATASRWVTLGRAHADRLILWGGEVPPDLDWARARDRLARTSLILVAGSNDRYITPKVLDRDERRLREHGIACAVERFEGGHEIIPEVLTRIL